MQPWSNRGGQSAVHTTCAVTLVAGSPRRLAVLRSISVTEFSLEPIGDSLDRFAIRSEC